MEQNILYSVGKEGASNLVSLLSESLESVVDMHNNDCVISSCAPLHGNDISWLVLLTSCCTGDLDFYSTNLQIICKIFDLGLQMSQVTRQKSFFIRLEAN